MLTWFCLRCDRPLQPPRAARLCPACARGEDDDPGRVIATSILAGYRLGIEHAINILGTAADHINSDLTPSEAITAAMALIRDQERTFITQREKQ